MIAEDIAGGQVYTSVRARVCAWEDASPCKRVYVCSVLHPECRGTDRTAGVGGVGGVSGGGSVGHARGNAQDTTGIEEESACAT